MIPTQVSISTWQVDHNDRARRQGNCFMKIVVQAVLLPVLISSTNFAAAQTIDPPSAIRPRFALTIAIPAVVRPKSEIVLETKYTNISDQVLCYSTEFREITINVRDSNGVPVPRLLKRQDAKSNFMTGETVAIPLLPGKSLTNDLMLDQLFDLTHSGQYTVDISLYDYTSKSKVISNSVRFGVPHKILGSARAEASIAISISTPELSVPAGWQVPVLISLKNLSRQNLTLATWEDGLVAEPDEFGSGIEIFDVAQNTKAPQKGHRNEGHGDSYPRGRMIMLPILPGDEIQQSRAVGNIFDLSKPGNYRIRVVLVDPITGRAVDSNPLNIAVTGPLSPPFTATDRRRPPFMVSIRRYPEEGDHHFPILICMTNISDHDIRLDNAITKDILQVQDSTGKPSALMPDGLTLKQQFGSTGSTTHTVNSRATLCGVITLDTLFDFSALGHYSFRVDRYDEPDALPGQKLVDLQIVQSNTVILTVPIP